ncbi:MAG: bifunctional proline dehydrogenase/L-glutamate gamma-semialdehyde dehydrogenase PutA, partial [Pseudomonadota bacterium]
QRLLELAGRAASNGIALTVDAEEADRLELSLEIFEAAARAPELDGWDGLGLAVQAYQKRARGVVDWLVTLARDSGRRIPVRLVKGAYWDTEIKHAQVEGYSGYPVFTRKVNTDVSYLACARTLLAAGDAVYPQFATHNAHTIASIAHFADPAAEFEYQRLHGMGEELYRHVIRGDAIGRPCRVYAPVGRHKDLLPYLVRRLLENGANTSFVNRISDEREPVEAVVADPIDEIRGLASIPHPRIVEPAALYGEERRNSRGYNLADREALAGLLGRIGESLRGSAARARPLVAGRGREGAEQVVVNPAQTTEVVGHVHYAGAATVGLALDTAAAAFADWSRLPVGRRAAMLRAAADAFEEHSAELLGLCIAEAGKTLPDAIAELREAVDFLRYYAAQAERLFAEPERLPGPTGESNHLGWRGRGVFVCISPWNFPLAIFTGQVAAALVAGNTVIAKPAEQTSLVAARAIELLHACGVPGEVLGFMPGSGAEVGGPLVADPRVAGVAFTGSTETARLINQTLAARDAPIAVLVAETGGQNAMIVDSSALPEQVVNDAVQSGFNSAGQRCSALRVLCVQRDVADTVIDLLRGAMRELVIGHGANLATDVGPVIDRAALDTLERHVAGWPADQLLYQCELPESAAAGTFMRPTLLALDSLKRLQREVFGPVVHVLRYRARDLKQLVDDINATGYGLTLGVHSRIDGRQELISRLAAAGNIYVNRNMVGAVVGVQPFGGRGLSGTGPKAGGPHYLHRFAAEYTFTNNTSAIGGNASLLSLD